MFQLIGVGWQGWFVGITFPWKRGRRKSLSPSYAFTGDVGRGKGDETYTSLSLSFSSLNRLEGHHVWKNPWQMRRRLSLKRLFSLNNSPSPRVTFQYSQIRARPAGFFIVRQQQNAKCQCIWCTDMLSGLHPRAHVAHSTAVPSFLMHHVNIVCSQDSLHSGQEPKWCPTYILHKCYFLS